MSDSPRTAILNVVGLTSRHIGPSTPFIRGFREREGHSLVRVTPQLPAVTSSMQATYLTGKAPGEHGIVSNIWYDRDYGETRNWKQSNHLVQGRKLWETLRETDPDYTCAKLFWWNNMYSTADYQITPRPIYRADGKKIFDVQTWPIELASKVKRKIGKFPFPAFWGPGAGLDSSKWIADCARWHEEKFSPNLSLVYLPHLDYNFQRLGPDDPLAEQDLTEIDDIVRGLVEFYDQRGVRVVLLSEYGITAVDRPVHLNRIFREKGWITWREELRQEVLDPGNCRALAVADHQIAHVYVNDPSIRDEVKAVLEETEGVGEVVDRAEVSEERLNHLRAGDFVAVADERSWFTYYWWKRDRKAPDFARTVDIHRKPGYDPVELFLDPKIRFPRLKVATKLARKALGMRMLMNVVPLDASLVKGSHGRVPEDPEDHPVLIGDFSGLEDESALEATEVHDRLLDFCRGQDLGAPTSPSA